MILGSISVVFFILFPAFLILSIVADVVNWIRGKPSQYTQFFFLSGDSTFFILILSACIVFLVICLFVIFVCLKHLFL